MDIADFDYALPQKLIAQTPLSKRDKSRLFVIDRQNATFSHKHFLDLPMLLPDKTVIVLNDTKVFKARLYGIFEHDKKPNEIFLLRKVGDSIWECLVSPGRKFHPGKVATLIPVQEDNKEHVRARVMKIQDDGTRLMEFTEDIDSLLGIYGHIPLPPYIKQECESLDRYQTIYAQKSGSVAAPTAGLHFTEAIFKQLDEREIPTITLTLHVGMGTFQPVKTRNIEDHHMHYETFTLSNDTATFLNTKKQEGYKILSVGTTTTRVLEHCAQEKGLLHAESGHTNLFIYPGYKFKFVDMMLTNFHLPKSTLLMLVSAFAGRELILKAYEEAIKEEYRFYSFGDAMLIL